MRWVDIRDRLRENLVLKLIAFFLALALWLFVNAGQPEAQTSLKAPVVYSGLQAGLMIVNFHPDFIDLQLVGPQPLLSLVDPHRLAVHIDLHGVGPGRSHFTIGPDQFTLPRQIRVTRISPAEITLDIDSLVSREVNVNLVTKGKVAKGYSVVGVSVEPSAVTVTGPSRDLRLISTVNTEPLDVGDASADVSAEVGLVSPGGLLKISRATVNATVRIQPIIITKDFSNLAVAVRGANFRYYLKPDKVDVSVKGPAPKLSELTLDHAVYVDAGELPPGHYVLSVEVNLPDGFELVRKHPSQVRLTLFAPSKKRVKRRHR